MHPEVQQDHPGDCPICGMPLEPMTVTAVTEGEENAELRDMSKRFWIGAALTLPVFVLAMAHLIPSTTVQSWANSHVSRWVQFALSTPVVIWAGWPFFRRGWRSIVSRRLNMFTLIAIGVGAAYIFSAVAMVMPGLFPHAMRHDGKVDIYFEAAAVIVVLVLLGQAAYQSMQMSAVRAELAQSERELETRVERLALEKLKARREEVMTHPPRSRPWSSPLLLRAAGAACGRSR